VSSYFTLVTDMPYQLRFQSCTSDQLIVPSYNLTTVSKWVFSVSATNIWNSLPAYLTSAPSHSRFSGSVLRRLFSTGTPILTWLSHTPTLHSAVNLAVTLGHIKNLVDDDDNDDNLARYGDRSIRPCAMRRQPIKVFNLRLEPAES